jgi:hypothetical protein
MSSSEHKSRLAATHDLARTANFKLRKEASLPELRLRFLVSHANMLDAITSSLTEIQQHQVECTNYLKAEERLRKSQSGSTSIHKNVLDSRTYRAEPKNPSKSKADSFIDSATEDRETSPSTSAWTSEIISQIGYELNRTPSRRASENAGSENGGLGDSTPSRDQSRSRAHLTFETPIIVRLC